MAVETEGLDLFLLLFFHMTERNQPPDSSQPQHVIMGYFDIKGSELIPDPHRSDAPIYDISR